MSGSFCWSGREYCQTSYVGDGTGRRFTSFSQRESSLQQHLAEYKEKQGELELRALTAEMEASHLRLELESAQSQVSEYQKNMATLNGRLDELHAANSSAEDALQHFHRKLGRIRTSLTKEVDKMKKNEDDLQLAYDSIMRCILEFRSDVICKSAFLSAVDLIRSTMQANSNCDLVVSKFTIPKRGTTDTSFFADTETEKLALLSPNTRKSRLQSLMSMLSEQAMCASTDEELLDNESKYASVENPSQKPPPIPPRVKSVPSIRLKSAEGDASYGYAKVSKRSSTPTHPSTRRTPPLPPKEPKVRTILESSEDFSTSFSTNASGSVRNSREYSILKPPLSPRSNRISTGASSTRRISTPSPELRPYYPYSGNYYTIGQVEFDTDSSDEDFEPFVPPKRSRYASEPFVSQQELLPFQKERRVSSPYPDKNKPLKKSSPILTKRPGWYKNRGSKKQHSEASLTLESQASSKEDMEKSSKPKQRSHSVDNGEGIAISPNQDSSEAVTGDMTSQGKHAQPYDSEDTTGGTLDYSKPFEHILWRKLGLPNGNAFSSSLPDLDRICVTGVDNDEDDDDPDGCTYLDPNELEEYCASLGNKELSDRIRTRFSKVLSCTYLSLTNVQGTIGGSEPNLKSPAQASKAVASCKEPPPRNNSPFLTMERFKKSDTLSYSGYSTDASSGFDNEIDSVGFVGQLSSLRVGNAYGDFPRSLGKVACSENVDATLSTLDRRGREGEREEEEEEEGEWTEENDGEQIYEEIDQYSDTNIELRVNPTSSTPTDLSHRVKTLPTKHTPLFLSQSVPPGSDSFQWHDRVGGSNRSASQRNPENPYATLKEVSFQSRGFKRAPTLPPRRVKKSASMEPGRRKHHFRHEPVVPGIGPLPKYMTLKSDQQRLQLVPLSNDSPNQSQDECVASENEPNNHLYSLGKFINTGLHGRRLMVQSPIASTSSSSAAASTALPPRRVTVAATPAGLANIREMGSGSGSEVTSPPLVESSLEAQAVQEAPETHAAPATTADDSLPPQSQTDTAISCIMSKQVTEKSGYLRKMDFRLRNWNRRWFVLNGTELKYYKPNRRALKGVINLDSWCKLVKGQSPECFQLVTPKKTYHLVCKSEQECMEWLQAVGEAMHLHKKEQLHDPLRPKVSSITGWAHMNHKGQSKKVWCALNGPNLDIFPDPQSEPIRRISVAQSSVKKRRDSILLDSSGSHSNLRSMLFTLRDSTGVTEICPENQEDKDSWYYHLSAIQCGEQNLQLTRTERLLSEIMTGNTSNPIDHPHWEHPALNCTSGPLQSPLTSLPSTSLNAAAKKLFQNVCHFLTTKLTPSDLTFHIHTVQYIINTCLKHCPLQDELYCHVLRQISGHSNCVSTQVQQGWLLLSIMISSFLPIKPKFMWYLQTYLNRHSISPQATISSFARYCQKSVSDAKEQGLRQCKPSNIELVYVLGNFAGRGSLDHTLVVPVYLTDGCMPDIEFTPFTTIRDLTSTINDKLGMPEASQTGFTIMCDWPGMDDATCCCPIPDSKVVDVLSTWSAALEELNDQTHLDHNTLRIMKSQRNILFTYKRRLFVQSRNGSETDKEAVLLAYQVSKSIHSDEYPVQSMDKAASMAAMMTQIEHGDWNSPGNEDEVLLHEAVLRFCPWNLTHLALDHNINLLQRKLVESWKVLEGTVKEQCARNYISIVQQWSQYGSTFFQAEEECAADSGRRRLVSLAVSEQGVSVLEKASMKVLTSYTYGEISTFGGNGEDHFMLVISSQSSPTTGQRANQLSSSPSQGNVVERIIFKMPKLKICEATFLIASYIEVLTS